MSNQIVASKRVSGKRDRHTKICTAQGVRDRRVRLSISIAREFFNLQDMLRFDKASKTVGWLLQKSKAAIEELTSSANMDKNEDTACDSNVVTHCEDSIDNVKEEHNYEDEDLGAKSTNKKKGSRKEHCCSDQDAAKETRRMMRVKARERARERTKSKKTVLNNPNQQFQLENLSTHQQDHQFLQLISPEATMPSTSPSYGILNKGISVEESIVIRSKSPNRLSSYNYNYDNLMPKDDQEGYYNDYYNNYLAKSELESTHSEIFQQPPCLSALNIFNLSTEVHINAKPWDSNFSYRNL